jgi:hypothetical protein
VEAFWSTISNVENVPEGLRFREQPAISMVEEERLKELALTALQVCLHVYLCGGWLPFNALTIPT